MSILATCIFRAQPPHGGHLSVVNKAEQEADYLSILLGSCGSDRDTHNPFTFAERKEMILACLPEDVKSRVSILPLIDWPDDDTRWVAGVHDATKIALDHFKLDVATKITLIGHSKDQSSFYLKLFPEWDAIEVPNFMELSATPIRKLYFDAGRQLDVAEHFAHNGYFHDAIPKPVCDFLQEFQYGDEWAEITKMFEAEKVS